MNTLRWAAGLGALAALTTTGVIWAAGRPVTPIGQLRAKDVGSVVAVSGVIRDASNFSAGFKFVISDSTGLVNATLFTRVYDELEQAERLNVGAPVTITGKLNQYKGALEIVPGRKTDVQIGPLATPSVAMNTAIAQNTGRITARPGERVVISGTVVAVESFKSGVKWMIDDGSGPRAVTVFRVVRERLPTGDDIQPGARVQVSGKVNVYRKVAEVVVALPYDVIVLESKK